MKDYEFGQAIARISMMTYRHQDAEMGIQRAQSTGNMTQKIFAETLSREWSDKLMVEVEAYNILIKEAFAEAMSEAKPKR